MATSKLKFTRTTTDKLTVKGGVLSGDLLSAFKNEVIDFSVALKTDEELDVPESEE